MFFTIFPLLLTTVIIILLSLFLYFKFIIQKKRRKELSHCQSHQCPNCSISTIKEKINNNDNNNNTDISKDSNNKIDNIENIDKTITNTTKNGNNEKIYNYPLRFQTIYSIIESFFYSIFPNNKNTIYYNEKTFPLPFSSELSNKENNKTSPIYGSEKYYLRGLEDTKECACKNHIILLTKVILKKSIMDLTSDNTKFLQLITKCLKFLQYKHPLLSSIVTCTEKAKELLKKKNRSFQTVIDTPGTVQFEWIKNLKVPIDLKELEKNKIHEETNDFYNLLIHNEIRNSFLKPIHRKEQQQSKQQKEEQLKEDKEEEDDIKDQLSSYWRVKIYKIINNNENVNSKDNNDYYFLFTFHHLISDATSIKFFEKLNNNAMVDQELQNLQNEYENENIKMIPDLKSIILNSNEFKYLTKWYYPYLEYLSIIYNEIKSGGILHSLFPLKEKFPIPCCGKIFTNIIMNENITKKLINFCKKEQLSVTNLIQTISIISIALNKELRNEKLFGKSFNFDGTITCDMRRFLSKEIIGEPNEMIRCYSASCHVPMTVDFPSINNTNNFSEKVDYFLNEKEKFINFIKESSKMAKDYLDKNCKKRTILDYLWFQIYNLDFTKIPINHVIISNFGQYNQNELKSDLLTVIPKFWFWNSSGSHNGVTVGLITRDDKFEFTFFYNNYLDENYVKNFIQHFKLVCEKIAENC
ncbi:hypothetical protein ABK040_000997 [Willaertia magna]